MVEKPTVITGESVADGILGLFIHAGALITRFLRVRLHAVRLHGTGYAVHAARCLVLGLVHTRLLTVRHDGLGDLVSERFAPV